MIIKLTQELRESLTKTELAIVQFINDNEDRLPELSIVDIAFDTYSSPATVSRTIRKCKINGFNELRYLSTSNAKKQEIHDMGEIMNKSLIEVQKIMERISVRDVLAIVDKLKSASRIYVLARGLSEYVGQEFSMKLQLLDLNSFFISDPNIMRIKTEKSKSSEVVFIFTLNGETKELIESAKNAAMCGCEVIVCTCSENGGVLEYANEKLVGFHHTNKAIKEFEVSSRIALNMIARIIIDYMVTY